MASITVSSLYINGVEMPTPAHKGVTLSSNKIWSTNTGRTTSGKMVGTIIAVKHKLEIKWPPLTMEQVAVIEGVVSVTANAFVPVRYTDMTGTVVEYTMYTGDISYTQYSWHEGIQYVTDAHVSCIEQ